MEELGGKRSGPSPAEPEDAEEGLTVPILLALAAIVAAILGARASLVSSDASGAWQTAVREEVKRSAALVEDVRYVYGAEAAVAVQAAAASVEADELRKSAGPLNGAEKTAVETEAFVRQTSADVMSGVSDLTNDPKYRAGDGYDVATRLADLRNQHPELVELDPGATMDQGSEDSRHAWLLYVAAI